MNKNEQLIPFDGRIGNGTATKWTAEEIEAATSAIKKNRLNLTEEERISIKFFAIKLQMKDYLDNPCPNSKIAAGDFLKKLIKTTGKKNKIFAKYIGLEESNLSSIISGRRKINLDLALKLEQIFEVNPSWWFEIQLKNEFLDLQKKKKTKRKKYSLKGLIRKVS